MLEQFSVMPSRYAEADPSLRTEIRARTGSDAATSGILRSMERYGVDPSIVRYDIYRRAARFGGSSSPVSWSVRAIRS